MNFRFHNKKNSFVTRLDVLIIVFIIISIVSVGVFIKLVLQKDTKIDVELLASGGEWWWGVPPPYYWNAKEIVVGAKEYDSLNKPSAEIIDIVKYGEDNRKFMWIKVRLVAKKNYLTHEYIFRQEALQIGKTIHLAPNNVSLIGTIVGIDGVTSTTDDEYIILTGKVLKIKPWEAQAITKNKKILDSKGGLLVEILDVQTELADLTTTTWTGEALHKKDPLFMDATVKMKMRTTKDGSMYYFNYYQPISIGNKIRVQFEDIAFESSVMSFEPVN